MRLLSLCAIGLAVGCDRAPAARAPDQGVVQRPAARDTSRPVFEIDLWPGEGRPVVEAVATRLSLRALPYSTAAVVHDLVVAPGQRLSFDSTRFQTLEPGKLRVLTPTRVQGRMLGAITHLTSDAYYAGGRPRADVEVDAARPLEYLQYRAEGTCFVRVAGQVVDASPCPVEEQGTFTLEREPETRWWIRLVGADGRAGWLLVSDSVARVVDRTF